MTGRVAAAEPAPPIVFRSAARSHRGARAVNEDRWLAEPGVGLWAVADGMGGHRAGDVAATLVVEALSGLGAFGSAFAHLSAVSERLQAVNGALVDSAGPDPRGTMGSTVVVLLAHEDQCACLWAGDSRAYRARHGRLSQLTRDHSLVQAMIDAGALAPEWAGGHAQAHVITRAVGAAAALELEMLHTAAEPGDVFLLCSDGLTRVVSDLELEAVLARGDLELAADALMDLALERGAPDNVTLVLVEAERG